MPRYDQEEALEVADRIVVMNHGKVEQIGTAQQVVEEPATAFVGEFLDLRDHGPEWLIAAKLRHRGFERFGLGSTEKEWSVA
jgi:sulfate/thiosulfate transport system ATP-binding protein